jgi:hypothetical protein
MLKMIRNLLICFLFTIGTSYITVAECVEDTSGQVVNTGTLLSYNYQSKEGFISYIDINGNQFNYYFSIFEFDRNSLDTEKPLGGLLVGVPIYFLLGEDDNGNTVVTRASLNNQNFDK